MPGCKVYTRRTPGWGRIWLATKGNLLNDEITSVTIVEWWAKTAEISIAFMAHLKRLGIPASQHTDQKRLDFANAYAGDNGSGGHWTSYHSLETMTSTYTACIKTKMNVSGVPFEDARRTRGPCGRPSPRVLRRR